MNRDLSLPKLVTVTTLLLCGMVPEARAQASDPQVLAAAQTLNERAQKAMKAKDYVAACPALEEIVRMVPDGLGAKLTLAECYEGSGRLASAWTMYTLVDAAAKPGQAEHKRTAHKKAEMLKPKLAQLTVVVPEAVRALPGIEIKRDDVAVGVAQWGIPLPVDRGKHVIVATATGKQRLEKIVEIEADGRQGLVEIAELSDAVSTGPVAVAPAPPTVAPPSDEDPAAIARRRRIQQTAALVGGGVGIIGLGFGAAFGIQAIAKKNESNSDVSLCHDDQCSPAGLQLRSDGLAAGTRSAPLLIAGGALLATGIIVFLTAPRLPEGEAKIAIGVRGVEFRCAW